MNRSNKIISLSKEKAKVAIYPVRLGIAFLQYRLLKTTDHPKHVIKQYWVKKMQKKYKINTFVETGTYLGKMIEGIKGGFNNIYSIELDMDLWEKANARFASYENIKIIQGDSAEKLPDILSVLKNPAIFWLDAHYSGGITAKGQEDSPIKKEIRAIMEHSVNNHILLIDDARHFIGENGYATMEELANMIARSWPDKLFSVRDDIIRILPQ